MSFDRHIYLCNHCPNKDVQHFHLSQKYLVFPYSQHPPMFPALGNHRSVFSHDRLILPMLELHTDRIIQCVLFYIWLLLISLKSSWFIHAVCVRSSFLVIAEWYSIEWVYQKLFIHSSFGGYLGFQFWNIVKLLWWFMYKFLQTWVFISLG